MLQLICRQKARLNLPLKNTPNKSVKGGSFTCHELKPCDSGLKHGKVHIISFTPEGFYCQTVYFSLPFTGSGHIRVLTTVNHGSYSSRIHDVTFPWVEAVTSRSFKLCMVESGIGSEGNTTIDWVAFQRPRSAMAHGSSAFNLWTTGTQCNTVTMSKVFQFNPLVWTSVRHRVIDRKEDAMAVWVESVDKGTFSICLREAKLFDGGHKNIHVDWVAFVDVPSSWNITETNQLRFMSGRTPREENNFAFCQLANFTNPFYTPPSIIITANHLHDNSDVTSLPPDRYAVSAWLEDVTCNSFRACVKDMVGPNDQHQAITIDYLVIGDIHPCMNVTCDYFAVCQAFAADDAQCVCPQNCPSYVDQVCATDGQTFDNECVMHREACRIMGNFSFYHPGSCHGFPMQKGKRTFDYNPSRSNVHCENINFVPYSFYPDKDVNVIITVNHHNSSDPGIVHDAPVSWVEHVSHANFTACMQLTGRYERRMRDLGSVDWLAYQGAPRNGVTGKETFSSWWTGTSCKQVPLPRGKFSRSPTVLITPRHSRLGIKHDAAMAWIEDFNASAFTICLRELQNFDGAHEELLVNWMVFDTLQRPLFKELGDLYFANSNPPTKKDNNAFCKKVDFVKRYSHAPTVLLTPSIRTNGRPNSGIASWVEHINASSFDVCVKEVYNNGYSPLTVHYVVLSEICRKSWTYFQGFCYKTSDTCLDWRQSQSACAVLGSDLTSVHKQEENVFVQQRHNGAMAWIGLNDVITEGMFEWADRTAVNFTYWAKNQPNDFRNQDCVHSLGVHYGYKWNDVQCTDCHNYTCRKDYDECSEATDECDAISTCLNTAGSYVCRCPKGYTVQEHTCNDINECGISDRCHVNSTCANNVGSYTCSCKAGFTGDGNNCTDIDECQTGSHRCHANAQCTNTIGSYICRCNSGHAGNGHSCADINECGGAHGCHANAQCINTPGSYICRCNNGFSGDGKINCNRMLVRDCSELYTSGERRNGVYTVNPDGRGSFQVYCDMTTDGGGWTVFQRRQDGSVNFYLNWNSYKTGFGNLNGEFWLGNDNIHRLTARTAMTLRVDLEDWSTSRIYAKYGSFSVGDEASKYRLSVSSYSGTAGDALSSHNNMAFSTKDRDNDAHGGNCASTYIGAWWYNNCHYSNLNGQYLGNKNHCKGVRWEGAGTSCLSLKNSEMKTKPQSF